MITTKDKPDAEMKPRRLTRGELLELRRWNTPTIYNGVFHPAAFKSD